MSSASVSAPAWEPPLASLDRDVGRAASLPRAPRQAGAVVEDLIAVIDREEGGAAAPRAAAVRSHPRFHRTRLGV
jgi:hypothetical protein